MYHLVTTTRYRIKTLDHKDFMKEYDVSNWHYIDADEHYVEEQI